MTRYKLLFSVLILLCSFAAQAQIPTAGLVGHWNLDSTANDVSGNGHHGTLHNVKQAKGKAGIANRGFTFDTINSYISIPYFPALNVDSYSICAVLKPDSFYTGPCQGNYFFNRGMMGTAGSYVAHYYDNPYNNCSTVDTNKYVFASTAGTGSYVGDSFKTSTNVHTGNWYCVVVTCKAGNVKIYVDGMLTSSCSPSPAMVGTSLDSIIIGRNYDLMSTAPYNFKGVIDDITLYSRVLADTDINKYCQKAHLDTPKTNPTNVTVYRGKMEVKLYPNPNNGGFHIEGTLGNGETSIEVCNIVGAIVYSNVVNVTNNKLSQQLQLNDLPNGQYVLRITGAGDTKNIPFIKRD